MSIWLFFWLHTTIHNVLLWEEPISLSIIEEGDEEEPYSLYADEEEPYISYADFPPSIPSTHGTCPGAHTHSASQTSPSGSPSPLSPPTPPGCASPGQISAGTVSERCCGAAAAVWTADSPADGRRSLGRLPGTTGRGLVDLPTSPPSQPPQFLSSQGSQQGHPHGMIAGSRLVHLYDQGSIFW